MSRRTIKRAHGHADFHSIVRVTHTGVIWPFHSVIAAIHWARGGTAPVEHQQFSAGFELCTV